MFALYFDSALVGMFALANSLVFMPLSIVTNSSTTVFLQKAAELKQTNPKELGPFIFKLYDKLILVAAIPLFIFSLTGEWILTSILGQEWSGAGFFSSFIAISSILGVVYFPLSVLFRILDKEAVNFRLNVIFIFLKLGGLFIGVYYHNIVISLIGYCASTILFYAVSLWFIFRLAEIKPLRLYRDLTLVTICFIMIIVLKGVNL
jgi:O-antigen/teichoic acid export membrane protein